MNCLHLPCFFLEMMLEMGILDTFLGVCCPETSGDFAVKLQGRTYVVLLNHNMFLFKNVTNTDFLGI